jgi:5-formyltetrahydrofolate cyclo-ligase
MTKKELRKHYLNKRKALSSAEYKNLNLKLFKQLFSSVDLSAVKVLHTFLPIEKNNEPDTWPIIDRIRKEYPKIKISIPRINDQTGELENFYFENKDQLKYNIWGIPEPKHGIPTEPSSIDMVFAPMLVFDRTGHRVGYGKGFYDRFFRQCSSNCKRIGICVFPPVDNIDDVSEYDERLDMIITPEESFKF